MSMMMSFCAVFLPRDVLDEILDLIESVSGGFPTYTFIIFLFKCSMKDLFIQSLSIDNK